MYHSISQVDVDPPTNVTTKHSQAVPDGQDKDIRGAMKTERSMPTGEHRTLIGTKPTVYINSIALHPNEICWQ